jgi:hypothetical protein
MKVWSSALVSAAVGYLLKTRLAFLHPIPLAVVVLASYGVLFFAFAAMLRVSEVSSFLRRFAFKG